LTSRQGRVESGLFWGIESASARTPSLSGMGGWPFGRWIVIVGTIVGLAFLAAGLLLAHERAFAAFLEGGAAALLAMGLLSVGQRFWGGAKVASANAAGVGLKFEEATGDAVEKAEKAVSEVNTRVSDQMTTVNDRLYDLEKVVLKEDDADEKG
jgi:hypothetical protein